MSRERHPSLAREALNLARCYASRALPVRPPRPVSVNLIVTGRCNSRCGSCDVWRRAPRADELSLAEIARLAGEIAALGTRFVALSGGEPLLRPDLPAVVAALTAQGLRVQLTTSGVGLTPGRAAALRAAGLDRVTVSVDSLDRARYARIRGVDWLAAVLANLRAVLAARDGLRVETNSVLQRENAGEFVGLLEGLVGLGVDRVAFSPAVVHANQLLDAAKADLLGLAPADAARLTRDLLALVGREPRVAASRAFVTIMGTYLRDPRRPAVRCLAGHLTLDIDADGSVAHCGGMPAFGSVRAARLVDLWYGAAAARSRADALAGRCAACHLSCKIEPSILGDPWRAPRAGLERLLRGQLF
ncbi:MAG TPA: radical SAM protein [Polyangia bacterium]|jgi:MoaA/NifB/PqqE/SkfB family radical SAM enzyme